MLMIDNTNLNFVQHIVCINRGSLVCRFQIQRLYDGVQAKAGQSGNILYGQHRTIDLEAVAGGDLQLDVHDWIRPVVNAVWGDEQAGPPLRYAPNGMTAVFEITGTPLTFRVDLQTILAPDQKVNSTHIGGLRAGSPSRRTIWPAPLSSIK
ncbi:hypothetical protein HNQ59_003396 [Chitinivorax tropicus]|uniref:Uncharacterized protein n=1 Tax=Chitinivorax tropicus TaxID=714531 RepID=A0A840MUT4_9PROT|nr:hypothetical protein [Chitinivorax tropicus]MBB5020083.1 hypothetical protein [Chitinivorax tropicus]